MLFAVSVRSVPDRLNDVVRSYPVIVRVRTVRIIRLFACMFTFLSFYVMQWVAVCSAREVMVVRLLCHTVLVRRRPCASGVIFLMVVRHEVLTVIGKAVTAVRRVLE